jgi:hypothetical protein
MSWLTNDNLCNKCQNYEDIFISNENIVISYTRYHFSFNQAYLILYIQRESIIIPAQLPQLL